MRIAFILAMALVTACRDEAPPAPTAEQADQLNEMDETLNALAQNESAKNEEGPEANASGPSNSSD